MSWRCKHGWHKWEYKINRELTVYTRHCQRCEKVQRCFVKDLLSMPTALWAEIWFDANIEIN